MLDFIFLFEIWLLLFLNFNLTSNLSTDKHDIEEVYVQVQKVLLGIIILRNI